MDRCPYCKSKLRDTQRVGHARTRTGPHIHMYEGYCDMCNLRFQRHVRGKMDDSGWFSTLVVPDDLVKALDVGDIAELDAKLVRYATIGKKWNDFKATKQAEDEYWRFLDKKSGNTGIAIVRNKCPIADFRVFVDL